MYPKKGEGGDIGLQEVYTEQTDLPWSSSHHPTERKKKKKGKHFRFDMLFQCQLDCFIP